MASPAGACLQCHAGDDREPGAAPIGPKVRNLNKDHTYEDGSTINRLTCTSVCVRSWK